MSEFDDYLECGRFEARLPASRLRSNRWTKSQGVILNSRRLTRRAKARMPEVFHRPPARHSDPTWPTPGRAHQRARARAPRLDDVGARVEASNQDRHLDLRGLWWCGQGDRAPPVQPAAGNSVRADRPRPSRQCPAPSAIAGWTRLTHSIDRVIEHPLVCSVAARSRRLRAMSLTLYKAARRLVGDASRRVGSSRIAARH